MRAGAATPTKITMAIGGYTFAYPQISLVVQTGHAASEWNAQ
jgi:hypothetical protein